MNGQGMKAGVIGAGAWGTALAQLLAADGQAVTLWALEPEVVDYIQGDLTIWERDPLENLAADGQLMAYRHDDFWQCMDTLRDLRALEGLWQAHKAPWKVW